ncbi:glycogen synthase [Clostridiaceae bacterium OttesenSCG-928-D20]|nr:glycogen synthase [Clostridiaceae bacterium OttesenSCG-928-D20]
MTRQTMKRRLNKSISAKGRESLPNILIAAAECMPFSKTGGLADVAGTLPEHLINLGFDCRVITPFHKAAKDKYREQTEHVCDFYITLGWRKQFVGIEKIQIGKVCYYLVDNEYYFGGKIYWGGESEGEQYAFFQRAIMEALPKMGFIPDVLHCNDWHTAMLPMMIKTMAYDPALRNIKTLMTIHNLAYQGKFSFEYVQELFGVDKKYYTPEFLESYDCANYLKAGCVFADWLSTVSPSYADEICTLNYGEGLHGILSARRHELSGIINGIDTKLFNPARDKKIAANYSVKDISGKAICKQDLLDRTVLDDDMEAPVFGMVTRITDQKGFDLIKAVMPGLIDLGAKFIILGTGNREYEDYLRWAESYWRGRVHSHIGYDEELANIIYAGSDFLLMPSKFEPCGISQMIAMRYGTIPVVRETGGLRDTVPPYNKFTGEGLGFSFVWHTPQDLYDAICRANELYHDKEALEAQRLKCMSQDFGFEQSAYHYGELYISLI